MASLTMKGLIKWGLTDIGNMSICDALAREVLHLISLLPNLKKRIKYYLILRGHPAQNKPQGR